MNLQSESPISTEDWEKAPATVQAVVILLLRDNQTLKEQVNQPEKSGRENAGRGG